MVKLDGTLVLLGAGKMGGAMLEGWLKGGADPRKIVAFDPAPPPEMKALLATHGIRLNPPVATIKDAEVLVIAVKPQLMEDVLPGIVPLKASNRWCSRWRRARPSPISSAHFGADAAVIRTMPNTPAAVGRGITAMVANPNVSAQPADAGAHAARRRGRCRDRRQRER